MRRRLLTLFLLAVILVCSISLLRDFGRQGHISDTINRLRIAVHKRYPERRGMVLLGHVHHGQWRE